MIRKARVEDVKKIHQLINQSASRGEMLPRSLGELYDNLRDYFVHIHDGVVTGTGALHICWENLAEVRSLCVGEATRGRGVGRALVEACVEEAKVYDIHKLFLLTYQVEFFEKCGFAVTDKKVFPQKIWSDCIKCAKFPECDETAMIREI
ncbi:MAG: Amino-acid acetyltransferase [Syntrophorhabdus sp. PtaB.Bin047]|jgi:amino-acid N-acetyltransferase|nr:MAG: Amino-acid acetyltransferase [Syntrophorhabdus sp. PtaB.Bin047]